MKGTLSNPFHHIKSQVILGSEGFVEKVRGHIHRAEKMREMPALKSLKKVLILGDILDEVKRHFHMDKDRLISKRSKWMRQMVMEMSYRYTKCNQEEIGRIFGVDYSTVSQNRRRMGIRLKEDQELRRAFEKVQERLDRLSKQKI